MVLSVVLIMAIYSFTGAIRPIILISGAFGNDAELEGVKEFVLREYPDADITTVTEFHGLNSFTAMWTQVEKTHELIRPVLDSSPTGVTMICYSQGIYIHGYADEQKCQSDVTECSGTQVS